MYWLTLSTIASLLLSPTSRSSHSLPVIYRLTIGWNLAREKRSYLIVIIISFVITTFIKYQAVLQLPQLSTVAMEPNRRYHCATMRKFAMSAFILVRHAANREFP